MVSQDSAWPVLALLYDGHLLQLRILHLLLPVQSLSARPRKNRAHFRPDRQLHGRGQYPRHDSGRNSCSAFRPSLHTDRRYPSRRSLFCPAHLHSLGTRATRTRGMCWTYALFLGRVSFTFGRWPYNRTRTPCRLQLHVCFGHWRCRAWRIHCRQAARLAPRASASHSTHCNTRHRCCAPLRLCCRSSLSDPNLTSHSALSLSSCSAATLLQPFPAPFSPGHGDLGSRHWLLFAICERLLRPSFRSFVEEYGCSLFVLTSRAVPRCVECALTLPLGWASLGHMMTQLATAAALLSLATIHTATQAAWIYWAYMASSA